MEERLIDKDDPRKIRIVTQGGETDAVDGLLEETETTEDALLDLPEDYDEDLVGLTPAMLEERLLERERARAARKAACEKLVEEGEALEQAGDRTAAEEAYLQATLEDPESAAAHGKLWRLRTKEFTDTAAFYEGEAAEEFSTAPDAVKQEILDHMREMLENERKKFTEEAEPLRATVSQKMQQRREAFGAHRRYMRTRFLICLAAVLLFAVGCAIAASYIVRVQGAVALVLTIVFGAIALIALGVMLFFARKLFVAGRLCKANEKLSSTPDGAALSALEHKLSALSLIFGDPSPERSE